MGGDVLDFRNLLQGYVPDSPMVFEFVSLSQIPTAAGTNTTIMVDPNGFADGIFNHMPIVTLEGVGGVSVQNLIDDGNLLLG